jgi:hypothetical protein
MAVFHRNPREIHRPEPVSHRLGHTTVEYTVVWQSVVIAGATEHHHPGHAAKRLRVGVRDDQML